ncbi:MAG: hydrogenase expression/formation protein HypE [Rhodothermales bacterium]|jgi:hydrogenase expression/formation protein HypE
MSSETITMAHGGGGRLMARLIQDLFVSAFAELGLQADSDAAALDLAGPLAFTTDSFVVTPRFFPGGDIGSLAVFGTVNDLAMRGAKPEALSLALILEEGLPMAELQRVIASVAAAAKQADVQIVTGDTKVVERGKGDGIFINTAGIGSLLTSADLAPRSIRVGDRILLSGDIGRHAVAIMAAREGIEFETEIESDLAPLAEPVAALIERGLDLHCLRDLTRGGLASALQELASASGLGMRIRTAEVPVCDAVRGASEMLGLDPLSLANEGRFIAIVASDCELRNTDGVLIGEVIESPAGMVILESEIGGSRIMDLPRGEQLPRIC